MKAAVLHKVHDPMTIEDFDMPKISADEVEL
jgi:D-arabinose 1-dehydrogenase-like Zn-dependent alcohol dehydrogenase